MELLPDHNSGGGKQFPLWQSRLTVAAAPYRSTLINGAISAFPARKTNHFAFYRFEKAVPSHPLVQVGSANADTATGVRPGNGLPAFEDATLTERPLVDKQSRNQCYPSADVAQAGSGPGGWMAQNPRSILRSCSVRKIALLIR